MKHLAHLSLLVIWLLGVVLSGRAVNPGGQSATRYLVVQTDLVLLVMKEDHVVLSVGPSEDPHWQIATPLPSFFGDFHRGCLRPPFAATHKTVDGSEVP